MRRYWPDLHPMKSLTILLADDHTVVREGLRAFLGTVEDIKVVGEATTGREAVELAGKLRPDVVLMDVAMPKLNGCEATRQILADNPAAKVLVLSASSDDAYVARLMEAGAMGFLEKQSSGQVLLRAIREVAAGKTSFSPVITKRLLQIGQKAREQGLPSGKLRQDLTPREAEVLQLVAEGAANKQIAEELGISAKTVDKHRQQLMAKLGIHDTAGLTRYAISSGIIKCDI
jgi:DNA-binding NarL/FixJ family response regulator